MVSLSRCHGEPVEPRPSVVEVILRQALVVLAIALASCTGPVTQKNFGPSPRIVALIPSLTEDLCAIGAAKQLAGVSQFSSDIPCAKGLPQVDDAATIDAEKIVALHPDL